MLECVVNISEGKRSEVIDLIARNAGDHLLDVHRDPDHHRSVLTLIGEQAARQVATATVLALDLRLHTGAHPRLGVLDVVPFVPLGRATLGDAIAARDRFAEWLATNLAVPCFLYGPERTLPEVRKQAFTTLAPDVGPTTPHETAGACAVGARPPLVAYNVWLREPDLGLARTIASELRGPHVRTLGLQVGDEVQVSMNLVDPMEVGPAEVFDAVAARASVARAELVGLVPDAVRATIDEARWRELDLDGDRTIEARLTRQGIDHD